MMNNTMNDMQRTKTSSPLFIIGQDLHIMNPAFIRAVDRQDAKSLVALAEQQVAAGARALDLQLSPAKKDSRQMGWTVETIRDAVDVPLFVSAHILSQPELLAQCRGTVTINSVTADPATLPAAMERAKEHGVELVVLLVRPGLTPFTVDERLQLAVEVLETATRVGLPTANLYLDPLFHLRPDPMTWYLSRGLPDTDSVLETIEMLPQLTGERVRTLMALSSASQFLPQAERAALHQRLLPLLFAAGLDAVILNCHDRRLMEIACNPAGEGLADFPPIAQVKTDLETATLLW
jgi:cobalamin-dependent methionine synthase I